MVEGRDECIVVLHGSCGVRTAGPRRQGPLWRGKNFEVDGATLEAPGGVVSLRVGVQVLDSWCWFGQAWIYP